MADSSIDITAGSGTSVDTRTEATNGNHRQVVVVGDPATNAGVAPVDGTTGLKVDLGADNDVTVTSGTITSITNVVHVDDNGSSLTVDGTITASNTSGDVAGGSSDSGNPVKIGGVNKTTPRTLTDGQRGDLNLDTRENVKVSLWAPNSNTAHSYGNGVSGTGVQRVTIASDSTGQINALQSGSWTVTANAGSGTFTVDSELPAAATLADSLATPTAPAVGSYPSVFADNNSQWNRQKSARADLNTSGVGVAAAGIAAAFDDTSPTAITENNLGTLRMSANRNLYNTIRDAAGNERGANVNASNQLSVSVDNALNVGLSKTGTGYAISSQTNLTTTATVSGSAGKFGGAVFMNVNSAPAYIQVFDTTGAVTLGTTTPTFVIPIPANATAANGVGLVLPLDVGIAMANGIKIAATTTATGSTTVSTGLTGFVYYN